MKRKLVVIYGSPFSGKSTLAWELGRSLGSKTAIVSSDQLLTGSIAVSDADHEAELDMAHIQLRLMVANYLKNGYNVIVEGPFLFERSGALYSYEADIDQLIALMRNLAEDVVIVRLMAPEAVLMARAGDKGAPDVSRLLRVAASFKPRDGQRFREFDTSALTPSEIAGALRQLLAPDD